MRITPPRFRVSSLVAIALTAGCGHHHEPARPPLEEIESRYVQLEFVERSDLRRIIVLEVKHVDPPFLEGAIVRAWREIDPGDWIATLPEPGDEAARIDTRSAIRYRAVAKPSDETPADTYKKERFRETAAACLTGAGLCLCGIFLGQPPRARFNDVPEP